ncbi:DUF4328 domain-containing protein [Flavobacterium sp. NKUCC04_CG]|uniref:DUF4328 domain-containing protein n=1 Tax=Flavobacterium sp. NKUCC04_CG TaxID=2842121 RepID=UPI001C5AF45E|nr:DUF4328 domain-containing protein [Flavobacterium sp. NKUCC04_CG]MBW3519651.1 DUF4328 domain-containing protein [Flavobacterium sp. NKUCC04_CG]
MNTMKPNEDRARAAVVMVWAVIVLELIGIISNYMQYDLLQCFSNGVEYTTEQLENNDLRVKFVTIIYGVFFAMSGITFIMWFRRAYYNLHQCHKDVRFLEGWAAGAWFVPILNLFRPFQIMKELFNLNGYLLAKNGIKNIKTFPALYLSAWWAFWLINNAMIQILNKVSPEADEVESLSNESLFYIGQSIISIIAGLLIIKIIKAYNSREKLLFELKPVEVDQ